MKQVEESLARRAEYLRLHPFSQGEINGRRERFVPDLALGCPSSPSPPWSSTARSPGWTTARTLFHFRDREQRGVDLVMEHRDGSVSAVEVKSAATVYDRDFKVPISGLWSAR